MKYAMPISGSQALGSVTTGNNSGAGGFVGNNQGSIDSSLAFGNVTVGSNAIAGGFAAQNQGSIAASGAHGSVTGGSDTVLGGFSGDNHGSITGSVASGSVTGGSDTALGGHVSIVNGKAVYVADADAFDLLKQPQSTVDSFTYVEKDAQGLTSTATVNVTRPVKWVGIGAMVIVDWCVTRRAAASSDET